MALDWYYAELQQDFRKQFSNCFCQWPIIYPGWPWEHTGKPGVLGLNLPVPENKYLQWPHPQTAPQVSYLKGNVMLHKGRPSGFINIVERILEWVWVSSRREKEGNGMATIIYWAPAMGRLYARDMTTKVFNLSTRYMWGCQEGVMSNSTDNKTEAQQGQAIVRTLQIYY